MSNHRIDPTRTTTLRGKFIAKSNAAYRKLASEIIHLVVTEDAFGLSTKGVATISNNTRFAFASDSRKLQEFKDWLAEMVDTHVLSVDSNGFIESAYKKAVERSYVDVKKLGRDALSSDVFAAGSKAQFLQGTFSGPVAQEQLKLLFTRSFDELKGVTDVMSKNISRVLARGLADGINSRAIARTLVKEVDISRKRAVMVARTEMANAYTEAQLDTYESLGVDEVGVLAEWITARDACPLCTDAAAQIYTIKQARGLIPLHPNCRCAWAPYVDKAGKKSKRLSGKAKSLIGGAR